MTQQVSSEEKEIQLTLQGEEAERHIAKLLKPLVGRGGQLFSKIDDLRLRIADKENEGLDILLNLSGIRFAISVKSKRYEKVKFTPAKSVAVKIFNLVARWLRQIRVADRGDKICANQKLLLKRVLSLDQYNVSDGVEKIIIFNREVLYK